MRGEIAGVARAPLTSAHLFFWLLVCAQLARVWRAVGLWQEADATDGFLWLPLGLAADVLVAFTLATLVWLLRARPRLAVVSAVLLGLVHLIWLGLNLVSFTLTQAPITFQRARGDEGVAIRALALLRWQDVVPAIAFALVALAVLPLAVRLTPRIAVHTRRRRVVTVLALSLLAYAGDALVLRERNFGLADHPALTLASSSLLGLVGDVTRPQLKQQHANYHTLLAARTPAPEVAPPPRQRDAMSNVIVFFSEGIAREHTSLAGTRATPNLLRRAQQGGLELTRYYSPYHKSIAAIFALVCADFPPPNGRNIVEMNARIDCGEMSDVLAGNGLRMGLFHGGDFGFYDKMMLLGMRHWDIAEDARVMSNPLLYEEYEWGIDDRATVDHLLAWIDTLPPDERFGALAIPITAHWPYWIPSDVEQLLPPISTKNNFLNAVHFLDEVFERLMTGLEQRGLAEDTAVVYLADHGETVGERPRATAGRRLAYQPSLHVPLVILAPGMWPGASTSDRLGSHVDLLPTILDVLAFPPDARHRGTSLLIPDREPRRMFIGASNGPRMIGWLDGDQKFIVNTTSGAREAYDLKDDPDERNNIIGMLAPAAVEQLEQDALAFADAHLAYLKAAKKSDREPDIEGLFLAAVDVRVRRASGVSVCPQVPDAALGARACPGEDTELFLGRKATRAGGGKRDCILVRPPHDGVLELEVTGQPWLPFVTRLRVAQTAQRREAGGDTAELTIFSDGILQDRRTLPPGGSVRMPFAPAAASLRVELAGGPSRRDVCITVSERGWRNRPVQDETAAGLPL